LPKKLKLNYSKNVFDIIQFGSSLYKENPKDIDIAVIYEKIPIKQQLEESQEIKKQLEKITRKPIHIKSFDLYSLLNISNFAREGILHDGKSLISNSAFTLKFGLQPKTYIYYSLKNLEKKEKIKFNYLLSGKGGSYGLLKKYGGKLLRPGLIEINPNNEEIFSNSIKKFKISFKIEKIFLEI